MAYKKRSKNPKSRRVLPRPSTERSHSLRQFGYKTNLPTAERRRALSRAVKSKGYAGTIRRLTLISNFMKNNNPSVAAKMRADAAWIRTNLNQYSLSRKGMSRKNVSRKPATKRSRRSSTRSRRR